jgi:hypothetical protein
MSRMAVVRLTALDACGAPDPGPKGTLVSSGFINVDASPQYQDPEEIVQANGNGDLCVDDAGVPQFRWNNLTMVMCRIDPDAMNLTTGNPLVVDEAVAPNTVGWRQDASLTGTANFALEVWMRVPGQACDADGNPVYGYWLFPFVTQARLGDWSMGNAALNMTLTARTSGGSQWGTGPAAYLVRRDAVTDAPEVLLTPLSDDQHLHFEWVTVAPPTPACGATVLA